MTSGERGTVTYYRTFTGSEQANRDAWLESRIAEDCHACVTTHYADCESWTPAESCPVHGALQISRPWWNAVNDELDSRWPGTWENGHA